MSKNLKLKKVIKSFVPELKIESRQVCFECFRIPSVYFTYSYLGRIFGYICYISNISICVNGLILSFLPFIRCITDIVVEGNPKVPFSTATTSRCREGRSPFLGLLHFTLDTYFIMLSVKQGDVKYHFLCSLVLLDLGLNLGLLAIGEHSTQ